MVRLDPMLQGIRRKQGSEVHREGTAWSMEEPAIWANRRLWASGGINQQRLLEEWHQPKKKTKRTQSEAKLQKIDWFLRYPRFPPITRKKTRISANNVAIMAVMASSARSRKLTQDKRSWRNIKKIKPRLQSEMTAKNSTSTSTAWLMCAKQNSYSTKEKANLKRFPIQSVLEMAKLWATPKLLGNLKFLTSPLEFQIHNKQKEKWSFWRQEVSKN